MEESQGKRESQLDERKVRAGSWRGKSYLHNKEKWVPKEEGGQAQRTSLGESTSELVDPKFSRSIWRVLISL